MRFASDWKAKLGVASVVAFAGLGLAATTATPEPASAQPPAVSADCKNNVFQSWVRFGHFEQDGYSAWDIARIDFLVYAPDSKEVVNPYFKVVDHRGRTVIEKGFSNRDNATNEYSWLLTARPDQYEIDFNTEFRVEVGAFVGGGREPYVWATCSIHNTSPRHGW